MVRSFFATIANTYSKLMQYIYNLMSTLQNIREKIKLCSQKNQPTVAIAKKQTLVNLNYFTNTYIYVIFNVNSIYI